MNDNLELKQTRCILLTDGGLHPKLLAIIETGQGVSKEAFNAILKVAEGKPLTRQPGEYSVTRPCGIIVTQDKKNLARCRYDQYGNCYC